METLHTPVMLDESLHYLNIKKSGIYFDGTLGFGGHAFEILDRLGEEGLLIATDVDSSAFNFSKEKFSGDRRIKIYNYNFSHIDLIAKIESVGFFDGIFADLGVSSVQLDDPSSGFTYRAETELDLRMDKTKAFNAADIVNSYSEEDLAEIMFKYGEEKNSRRIARKICETRIEKKIKTTKDLSDLITELTPQKFRIKTLSRVFQALRIYVNDELNSLKAFLSKSVDLLKKDGVIVVISYHSLEDRIVKELYKYESLDCICPKDFPVCRCDKEQRLKILTKKIITPGDDEIKRNYRARSAKLRAAVRL